MPHAKNTYERTEKVYKFLLKDFILEANSNYEIKVKELLVRAEVQKRDFTKRQLNIISTIISFSFNYGKETALLKASDFALAGISAKKINEELTKLIEMEVINWDKDFNEFRIEEPRFWKAPYHNFYDDQRSQELFLLNLKHAGFDVEPVLIMLKQLED